MQIVLASGSFRRRELLSCLLSDFKVIPAKIDERKFAKLTQTPEELVMDLAKLKAKKVIEICERDREDVIVMAADTVVVLGNKNKWEVIGKPIDKKEARDILKKLRGEMHKVFTGICVLQSGTGWAVTDYVVSEVRFKNFSDKMMNDYIATGKPLDKAGAYGIQEIGEVFVDGLKGSFTNVMGLPVEGLAKLLRDFRVDLRRDWRKRVGILCGRSVL